MHRKKYLGLLDKAEKLGKGELSIEEYIKKSKTSVEELITFAKKMHMSGDIIRGLYKQLKPYKSYIKPFINEKYLNETKFIIDGREVKPTQDDIDNCIKYLKSNDILLCNKIVVIL